MASVTGKDSGREKFGLGEFRKGNVGKDKAGIALDIICNVRDRCSPHAEICFGSCWGHVRVLLGSIVLLSS